MRYAFFLIVAVAIAAAAAIALRIRASRHDPVPEPTRFAPTPLDVPRFWLILDSLGEYPAERREERLREMLGDLSVAEIASFAAHYHRALNRAYTWEL